jgi:hypothetical protein
VEETPVVADLGIGVAAGAVFADELAAVFLVGNFSVCHSAPLSFIKRMA